MNLRSLLGAVEPNCGMSWQVKMFVFRVDVGCFLSSIICRLALPSSYVREAGATVYNLDDGSGIGPYDDDGDDWALLASGQSFPLLLP
jgi:hypothetical protein